METKELDRVKLMYSQVLIETIEEEAGAFIVPDAAKDRPKRGKVIRVGPGYLIEQGDKAGQYILLKPKVDDIAIFQKFSGTEVELDGKKYLIMDEAKILALL